MSAMKALSGSSKRLTIKTKRRDDQRPIAVQFTVLQSCLPGWTLDSFQLVVKGITQYQFVVGDLTTEPNEVRLVLLISLFFSVPPDGATTVYHISNRGFSDFTRTYYCDFLNNVYS